MPVKFAPCYVRLAIAPAVLFLLLAGGAVELAAQPMQRHPVPGKAERDAARAKIEGIFATAEAATPQQQADLARQMLNVAAETKNDAVSQFVLLNMSRELAAESGEARLAMQAVDLLQANFDFDTSAVRLATLGAAVKSPVPPAKKQEVLAVGVEMVDAMMTRDEYDAAGKLAAALLNVARRARDKAMLDSLIDRRDRAAKLQTAYTKAQAAINTLKSDPDNADANLAAGRFYLFAKADWGRALPLLVKGSDAALASAAGADAGQPAAAAEQLALADRWWALAAAQSEPDAKRLLQSRAMQWYQRSVGDLSGLAKIKAEKRLQLLADAGVKPGGVPNTVDVTTSRPSPRPQPEPKPAPQRLPANLLATVDSSRHAMNQAWDQREGKVVSPNAHAALMRVPVVVQGSYELNIEFTRNQGNGIVAFVFPVADGYSSFMLSAARGGESVFDGQQQGRVSPGKLTNGRRYLFTLQTEIKERDVELRVFVDGKAYTSWKGPIANLRIDKHRQLPGKGHVGLYAHQAGTAFHSLTIRAVDDGVTLAPDAVKEFK